MSRNTSGPPTRDAPATEGLEEDILRAAVRLIDDQGLAALSFREVARRAGVSHQAPYHYFADREAILAALAERGFTKLRDAMAEARRRGATPTDVIEHAIAAYVTFACDYPAYFRIMFRPELVRIGNYPSCQAMVDASFKHVPEMVTECMTAGFPESVGVDVMTTLFWSTAHGLAQLLVEGQLATTLPNFAEDRRRVIAQIAGAMRLMVERVVENERQRRKEAKPAEGEQ